MTRILIVEDEPNIQNFLRECLEDVGYKVDTCSDGMSGVTAFNNNKYDLLLLDLMLPKMDGYTVCELIRQQSNIPIIMLTAMGDEKDQIKGFDVLADDYITKPFSLPILLKRIESALRKNVTYSSNNSILMYDNIILNQDTYEVSVNSKEIILTGIEFKLLKALLLHKGQVFSRTRLLDIVWGSEYNCTDYEKIVTNHIMNLRKKIGVDCIQTIRGIGYKIG